MAMYRPHKGSLAESLKESVTVRNMEELRAHLDAKDVISVQYYTWDERLGQETYIVKDDVGVCGFLTDVDPTEFFHGV